MSFPSARTMAAPLAVLVALGTALALRPQIPARTATAPVVGKSPRYCNPLPLETSSRDGSPQGVGLGDVTTK